ncbi:MAG: TssN family type VI secretion system protein [Tunicatimonas sp.]
MIAYYLSLGILLVAATVLGLAARALPTFQIGKLLGYALTMTVLLLLSAVLPLLFDLSPSQWYWLLAAWGTLVGIIHVILLYRTLPWSRGELFLREGLLTLVIGLAGVLGHALMVSQVHPPLPPFALSGALLGFLLPFLLHKAFQLWKSMPPPLFSTWLFPQDQPAPELTFQQTIPVRFNFSKSPQQPDPTIFTVVAPSSTLFGDLFHSFILDYNRQFAEQPIQEYQAPNEWIFYVHPQRWWQKKKLINPALNVVQNQLQTNQLVSAVRVSYQQ